MSDLAQGLALQLLWKVNLGGTKLFLEARYHFLVCPQGGGTAAELLRNLFCQFYARLQSESPIRSLAEKCRLLAEGQTGVTFNDSSNLDVMQLSMALNQYRSHVEQLAYYDPVYAVGNRSKYLRDANMLISYDKKRRFSLFCIDISSFSNYNDLFNVQTGDEILREVSGRLKGFFGGYIYRINGDVFLGIHFRKEHPDAIANRLRQALAVPVKAGPDMFTISVNIGICTYPVHADTPEELLERVQVALRYAKRQDGMVTYNAALMRLLRDEAVILRLLETRLGDGTLEVWYQPLMDLRTGRFTAAEALLRLRDAQGRLLPANQVIAIAERNGLVVRVGEYALRRACSFMRRAGLRLGLSRVGINLSVQHFLVENCTGGILEAIRASGAEPGVVSLEITETVLIQSFGKIKDIAVQLQQAGLHIVLDDFGAGYSSLNYLSRLPVDVLKIDLGADQRRDGFPEAAYPAEGRRRHGPDQRHDHRRRRCGDRGSPGSCPGGRGGLHSGGFLREAHAGGRTGRHAGRFQGSVTPGACPAAAFSTGSRRLAARRPVADCARRPRKGRADGRKTGTQGAARHGARKGRPPGRLRMVKRLQRCMIPECSNAFLTSAGPCRMLKPNSGYPLRAFSYEKDTSPLFF